MAAAGALPRGLDFEAVNVEPPRDPAHGDLATNAALVLAKPAGLKPREIAETLAGMLAAEDEVADATIAGPGFINLRLKDAVWRGALADILTQGTAYGTSDLGRGQKVNVEYVSANPTGPLHVANSRVAVAGDALAALLEKAGYDVTREYYVNDAGAQVEALARSVHLRYREALGDDIGAFPEGLYPGGYVKPVAEHIAARDGAKWCDAPEESWLPVFRDEGVAAMMALIRDDLRALGIRLDVFSSERRLAEEGRIEQALEILARKGLIYEGVLDAPKGFRPEDWEPRPQTLFRATAFGDDVDRPLKKSDGSWTYLAGDIAYHLDKFHRGFREMVNVWGADHGGYIKRLQAAIEALTDGEARLEVQICQLVRLFRAGEPVAMSKRVGEFVTAQDVIGEVGAGVLRFIMLTRKNDAALDFDFVKVLEQSKDNPVFYVQYAHARCHSVLRQAGYEDEAGRVRDDRLRAADLALLSSGDEMALIRTLAAWPRIVETAAQAHEPHRIAFYLQDLASAFHGLWTKGNEDPSLRFIVPGEPALTASRLALVRAVGIIIASGLSVMGVEPVREMR